MPPCRTRLRGHPIALLGSSVLRTQSDCIKRAPTEQYHLRVIGLNSRLMPNIATALKQEISRLARKELRAGTDSSKKAISAHRHEIADLKRRMQSLEREVARLRTGKAHAAPAQTSENGPSLRFRPDGFVQHRKRLGLSAREMGLLLDASALSVYKWESGQARPRAKHLLAIAEVRKMGKREASKRLEQLTAAA